MKKLFFLMACLLASLIVSAETITITSETLGLTGSYSNAVTKTISNVDFCHSNLMKSSGNIQAKASAGTIYNTTAIPGKITSIEITHTSAARSTSLEYSTDGNNWKDKETFSGSKTSNPTSDYAYFRITRGSNAAYWSSIVITYVSSDPTAPSLEADPTSVDFGAIVAGEDFETKTVTVTAANLTENITATVTPANAPFTVNGDLGTASGDLTIACTATELGTYKATLTIASGDKNATVDLKAVIKEATGTFVRYTASELVAGEYIICDGTKAMTTTLNSDKFLSADVVAADNKIENPEENLIWHVEASGDNWVIYNETPYVKNYLAWTGSGANFKTVNAPTDDNDKWSVTIHGDGTFDLFNVAAGENNRAIRKSKTSHKFGPYVAIGSNEEGYPLHLYARPVEAATIELEDIALEQYRESAIVADVTPVNATLIWESEDPTIATVQNGVVTAVGVGETAVRAKSWSGKVVGSCAVKVTDATPITCAKAAEYAATLTESNEKYPGGKYTVQGWIIEVTYPYSEGTMSFTLADDKDATEGTITAYKATPVDANNLPKEGDAVELIGYISQYTKSGATTLQIQEATAKVLPEGPSTALENVIEEAKAVKVIENGQLVIIKDGVRYSVLGSPL